MTQKRYPGRFNSICARFMGLMKIYDYPKQSLAIEVSSGGMACWWAWRWVAVFGLLALSGCASQTRKAVQSLDRSQPAYEAPVCRSAQSVQPLHDDIKLARSVVSPGVLLLAGAPALLPVLVVNMGLDAWDRMDASSVSQACGGHRTPTLNLVEDVVLGAGFDLFTGRLGGGR